MRKYIILIICIFTAAAANAELTFTGNSQSVITVTPETSTGLNDIYVLYNTTGVSATYKASSASATVTWYRYSNLGGGYAEEVSGVTNSGTEWTLPSIQGNMGYIVEEGTSRYYCWVVDYSADPFSITALNAAGERECDVTSINTAGSGSAIYYYTINGRRMTLSRELTLTYNTLTYNEETNQYVQTPATQTLEYLPATIHVTGVLCDTQFQLSGDRFLRQWGRERSLASATVPAYGVACEATATQQEREADNEQTSGDTGLGGSAPAVIDFSAAVTDAVVFNEWQFATDSEFENITLRMNQLDCTYTFNELGTTYVRFMCANSDGACEAYSATYEVYIGDSDLVCPNAFSPGASEGVNDEWKVSYKSIVKFECHIFNKWGTKMCSFTDPSQGWDGRYRGKLVPAGVYYYVIKAEGADGRKYNLSGDINIVNYK